MKKWPGKDDDTLLKGCESDQTSILIRILKIQNCSSIRIQAKTKLLNSVADPDPRSGAFLPPGSGMNFFPDPGSRIPDQRGMFFGENFLRILVILCFY
jgi:hypothetical protein